MRGIKFRAWFPKTEWMNNFEEGMDYMIDPSDGELMFEGGSTTNAILMQYTGLKDKNGVEIYEGDIVRKPRDLHIGKKVVAHKGEFQNDAFVEWVDGSFRLNKLGDDSKHYYGVLNFGENTQPELLEVIGNIHENKELLK